MGNSGISLDSRYASNFLTTGDETFSRDILANTAAVMTSQQMRLVYFIARTTETSTQGRVITGNTAAAATPTLCRFGVYSIAANGDGTLVASCANDTALFATTFTVYTRSWSVSFAKTAGQRYAFAILVVTGAATPTFSGASTANTAELFQAPILCSGLAAQSDLPSTFTAGSVASTNSRPYGVVLP